MATQTKKQRSEAAKKAAATRARNAKKPDTSKPAAAKASNDEWPSPPNTTRPPNVKVDGTDILKLDRGAADLEVEQLDGAYAVLKLGKERRLVGQADLVNIRKRVAKAIQLTY